MAMSESQHYYVPHLSKWPLVTAFGLGVTGLGAGATFHSTSWGPYVLALGLAFIAYIMVGWFGAVIQESQAGHYNVQIDRSFRIGMFWFIFSEVWFFAAFFGTLFYARNFSVPWLGGEGAITKLSTNPVLWPEFSAEWPLLTNPDPNRFPGPNADMGPLWLPLINTFILILSSVTITYAHHALLAGKRKMLNIMLGATIFLGLFFVCMQAYEYHHAYTNLGLKLSSGIYGTTFYMLTGFHGLHVTIGSIILLIIWLRCLRGDFNSDNHFGFEASAWYWHFVDVVWLCLFLYVYVLPLR